jgi:hypothetical protein
VISTAISAPAKSAVAPKDHALIHVAEILFAAVLGGQFSFYRIEHAIEQQRASDAVAVMSVSASSLIVISTTG